MKNLFLFDSLGAMLSVMLLGLVLPRFEALLGMPPSVLFILSSVAFAFGIYSLLGYLGVFGWRGVYLKAIAISNLLYCCATLVLMVVFYEQLSLLGIMYFIGEILLIGSLAMVEIRVARRFGG